MPHHNPRPLYETRPGIEPGTFGLGDECSTTELTLLLLTSENLKLAAEAGAKNIVIEAVFRLQYIHIGDHTVLHGYMVTW